MEMAISIPWVGFHVAAKRGPSDELVLISGARGVFFLGSSLGSFSSSFLVSFFLPCYV